MANIGYVPYGKKSQKIIAIRGGRTLIKYAAVKEKYEKKDIEYNTNKCVLSESSTLSESNYKNPKLGYTPLEKLITFFKNAVK